MEAEPYNNGSGLVPVTGISISQADFPINGVEQPFEPSVPVPQGVTLYSGQPGEVYNVGVSWADGRSYQGEVGDNWGGSLTDVRGPNVGFAAAGEAAAPPLPQQQQPPAPQ